MVLCTIFLLFVGLCLFFVYCDMSVWYVSCIVWCHVMCGVCVVCCMCSQSMHKLCGVCVV